jgi:hypothetical protein
MLILFAGSVNGAVNGVFPLCNAGFSWSGPPAIAFPHAR